LIPWGPLAFNSGQIAPAPLFSALVAVAAAIFLLDHVPGPARLATMPQALRSVMPRLAAQPGSCEMRISTRA